MNLTKNYELCTKSRELFLVTAKDTDDSHEYIHERARVQPGSSLSLFAGSGARAGAIVESSAYRKTNQRLYYRVRFHEICYRVYIDVVIQQIKFQLKWGEKPKTVKRWVKIEPEFLKGWRFRDDVTLSV